jgi:hypothetical protein
MLTSLLAQSWPGDLKAEYKAEKSSVDSLAITWHCGKVLLAPRDRLENWSRTVVLLLDYCPVNGCNQGWLPALTRHYILKRQLYVMGLTDSLLPRLCSAEEETAAYVLCMCQGLATLRHTYLGSYFLDPEYVRNLNIWEQSGMLLNRQDSHDLGFSFSGTKGM